MNGRIILMGMWATSLKKKSGVSFKKMHSSSHPRVDMESSLGCFPGDKADQSPHQPMRWVAWGRNKPSLL